MLLYEITDVQQNPFAGEQVLALAFFLAVLFFWMHICQAVFCTRLYSIHSETESKLGQEFWQALRVQAVITGTKVWAWPIGLAVLIPHTTVTMFYQSSLIGSGEEGVDWRATLREAKQDAVYRPGVAVWLVVIVFVLRAILWMNLLVLLFSLPELWKTFTGVETELTRWPELLDNATAIAALGVLAYLALDPVVKAACVLRRFERQSQGSGLDLRLRLKVLARIAMVLVVLAAGCAECSWAAATQPLATRSTVGVRPPVTPERMRHAVQSVFHDPAEVWNLPLVEPRKKSNNPIFAFMDAMTDYVSKWWKAFSAWLRHVMEAQPRPVPPEAHGVASSASAWLLVSVFSGLVGAGVLFAWVRRSRRAPPAEVPTAEPAAKFDIASETTLADDQPEDEWLRMAREHRTLGNSRLALRALYLSILAALARAGLITVARGKSNRDYLREFERRGKRLRPELAGLFGGAVQIFEKTWYGTFPVTEQVLEDFEGNIQELRTDLLDMSR
jgi:hypothetical protein